MRSDVIASTGMLIDCLPRLVLGYIRQSRRWLTFSVAYLLGGMDAESVDWSDFPEVKAALEDECYFKSVVKLRASTTACGRSGCAVIKLCHLLAVRRDFAAVPPAIEGWL